MGSQLPHLPSRISYPSSESLYALESDIGSAGVEEERKGLLSDTGTTRLSDQGDGPKPHESERWRWLKCIVIGIALVSFGSYAVFLSLSRGSSLDRAKAIHFDGETIRSNGTHDFKRTVLIVSIDGLR